MKKPANIDEYIIRFPEETQVLLQKLRETIRQAAPEAKEVIGYGMPAFRQNRNLVYFAAFKNHIGLYPTSMPIKVFREELSEFKTSKGAIQFPLNKPLQVLLIKKIVKFRVEEDAV